MSFVRVCGIATLFPWERKSLTVWLVVLLWERNSTHVQSKVHEGKMKCERGTDSCLVSFAGRLGCRSSRSWRPGRRRPFRRQWRRNLRKEREPIRYAPPKVPSRCRSQWRRRSLCISLCLIAVLGRFWYWSLLVRICRQMLFQTLSVVCVQALVIILCSLRKLLNRNRNR